jgi:Protein of unknown function (DUF3617)
MHDVTARLGGIAQFAARRLRGCARLLGCMASSVATESAFMHKSLILSLAPLAALALAGCGQSAPEDKAANAGAAAEMAFRFEPGQYHTTVAIEKLEIPGMPAGMAGQMKAAMGKTTTSEHCITPESAAKGVEAMKQHMGQGQCKFESFNARGGTIDSIFSCEAGPGMTMRASSQGTYTSTGSKVAAKVDMTGPSGKGMHLEQTMTTERIGDCS